MRDKEEAFGTWLRWLLSRKDAEPKALALALGFRDTTLVYRWQRGEELPTLARLASIARFLKLSAREREALCRSWAATFSAQEIRSRLTTASDPAVDDIRDVLQRIVSEIAESARDMPGEEALQPQSRHIARLEKRLDHHGYAMLHLRTDDSEPAAKVAATAIKMLDTGWPGKNAARLLVKAYTIMALSRAEAAATPLRASLAEFDRAIALGQYLGIDDWDLNCYVFWRAGEQGRKLVQATKGSPAPQIAQDARRRLQRVVHGDRTSDHLRIAACFELWKLDVALGKPTRAERWLEQAEDVAKEVHGEEDVAGLTLWPQFLPELAQVQVRDTRLEERARHRGSFREMQPLVRQMHQFRMGFSVNTERATMPYSLAQPLLHSAAEDDQIEGILMLCDIRRFSLDEGFHRWAAITEQALLEIHPTFPHGFATWCEACHEGTAWVWDAQASIYQCQKSPHEE